MISNAFETGLSPDSSLGKLATPLPLIHNVVEPLLSDKKFNRFNLLFRSYPGKIDTRNQV